MRGAVLLLLAGLVAASCTGGRATYSIHSYRAQFAEVGVDCSVAAWATEEES